MLLTLFSAQKIKLSIEDLFSKCDQIHSLLWIWPHLLKKTLNEKLHFLCSDSRKQEATLTKPQQRRSSYQ